MSTIQLSVSFKLFIQDSLKATFVILVLTRSYALRTPYCSQKCTTRTYSYVFIQTNSTLQWISVNTLHSFNSALEECYDNVVYCKIKVIDLKRCIAVVWVRKTADGQNR